MTDREKLIELISDFVVHVPHEEGQTWEEACADHLLANGVTVQQWIPVSEPPEEPKEYIVMIKGAAEATTLLFDGSDWIEEDKGGWTNYYAVTHWMPLPEKPKEG